ncbi:MAG: hypothetical protein GKR95_00485 [Gammaproteobacteria bacterium]|nr:hypothetical protein [Gammaproteobacteria bacterium]
MRAVLRKALDFAINCINIMPSADRDPKVVFQTLHYLNWLGIIGVQTVNGATCHTIGASKVMQNGVFTRIGLRHPRGISIYRPEDGLFATDGSVIPLLLNPRGSGAGIGL